jgi:hypothetical protein
MGAVMPWKPALLVAAALVFFNGTSARVIRAEQQPPPIHGVTGTVATEETVKDVPKAGRGILSRVARLFGAGRDSATGDDAAAEMFAELKSGAAVLVQDVSAGGTVTADEIDRLYAEGEKRIDGTITAVNSNDRTISVRLADGTRQTLQFLGRVDAADPAITRGGSGARVVFVDNAAGERVAYLFRRVA